jgi:hypothetical protein
MVIPGVTNEKRVGEASIVGIRQTVETLPRDDHGHRAVLPAPVAILKAIR